MFRKIIVLAVILVCATSMKAQATAEDVNEAQNCMGEVNSRSLSPLCQNLLTKFGFVVPTNEDLAKYETRSAVISQLKSIIANQNFEASPDFDKSVYEAQMNTCEKKQSVAAECCLHPERCLTTPDGEEKEIEGMSGQMIQLAMGTAIALPASSIAAACGKMKTVSMAMSGVNLYLAHQCSSLVKKCKEECGNPAKEIATQYGDCDTRDQNCLSAKRKKTEFESAITECQTYDNQTTRLANQAIGNQLGAKYADMCRNLAQDKPKSEETDLFSNPDCTTSAAAASPICQAQCSRPGASSDPNCAGFFANNPGGAGYDNSMKNPDGTKNPFDGVVPADEGPQGANLTDFAAVGQKSSGGGGGGGGGGLGGGGVGDAGSGDAGSQSGGAGGYDTNIARGLASGNGYSAGGNLRSGSSGGFSGYGGSAITNAKKPFNLRDYLPGGKPVAKMAMRGLASSIQDISPAHADIFQKVTNRFYQVCLRDALYDCSTLKKKNRGGN